MKKTGIYIHIPFCRSKCGYCDFNSYAGMEECISPYFCALNREIELTAEKYKNITVDTIYFGGGTPTLAGSKHLAPTLEKLFSSYNICSDAEITAECNPGTVDFDELKRLRNCGINRLSIGLQSVSDRELKMLGRIHTYSDFVECFNNARRAGFDNLSLDLMYGLPDQTTAGWTNTLNTAAALGCEHISCYSLKIEDGTPFSKRKLNLPDDDTVADMYEICFDTLNKHGYKRYEISNFAKDGKYSRHNLKYWRCDDFLGLGAGAFSCMDGERFSNALNFHDYIHCINESQNAVIDKTTLSENDKIEEFVFLGLRCARGISLSEFENRFGKSIFDIYGGVIQKYQKLGYMHLSDNRLSLTGKAFFVSNTILSDFIL